MIMKAFLAAVHGGCAFRSNFLNVAAKKYGNVGYNLQKKQSFRKMRVYIMNVIKTVINVIQM